MYTQLTNHNHLNQSTNHVLVSAVHDQQIQNKSKSTHDVDTFTRCFVDFELKPLITERSIANYPYTQQPTLKHSDPSDPSDPNESFDLGKINIDEINDQDLIEFIDSLPLEYENSTKRDLKSSPQTSLYSERSESEAGLSRTAENMAQFRLSVGTHLEATELGSFPESTLSSSEPVIRGLLDKHQHLSGIEDRNIKVWQFILNVLDNRNDDSASWVSRNDGLFRINNTEKLCKNWEVNRSKGIKHCTFDNFSRTMRQYIRGKISPPQMMSKHDENGQNLKRLHYRFITTHPCLNSFFNRS